MPTADPTTTDEADAIIDAARAAAGDDAEPGEAPVDDVEAAPDPGPQPCPHVLTGGHPCAFYAGHELPHLPLEEAAETDLPHQPVKQLQRWMRRADQARDTLVACKGRRARLADLNRALTADTRDAIVYGYGFGLEYEEMADLAGVSRATVAKALASARKAGTLPERST